MKFSAARAKLPSLVNSLLAVLSAILLTLAFPDFDLWFLAWFALVPLFFAIEREKKSIVKSFVLGWIFGVCFFTGTCWWLTFAPTTYGGVPLVISYLLLFGATSVVGLFPAIFAAIFSLFLKRFGSYAILSAPFLWTATEFLRFNLTGNSWNAIGYSQAFSTYALPAASIGGVYFVGFLITTFSSILSLCFYANKFKDKRKAYSINATYLGLFFLLFPFFTHSNPSPSKPFFQTQNSSYVVAIQPNVPMNGLKYGEWENLRQRHIDLAENTINSIKTKSVEEKLLLFSQTEITEEAKKYLTDVAIQNYYNSPKIIIFPESPMNFQYENDREFQGFIKDFAVRNNSFVLFNSAQPNTNAENFYNSAVMINPRGEKIAQYDKIHLVPFGEYAPVPEPLAQIVPTMVGNFQYGDEYDLLPFGEVKAGVMICFESHFASLSREFARNGADVLIEMTNDGYLGETPILRQHLANAVFRAVETNRPVLRVTNVGITAYINERGEVLDAAKSYTEDTRVWRISKSDGKQTFYVRYGDWFAWLCSIASLALLFFSFWKRKINET